MFLQKVEATAITLLASCVLVVFLVSGYLMFLDGTWPTPVVVYGGDKFLTTQLRYRPGDEVFARIKATKHRDLVGTVHWTMIDGSQPPVQFAERALSLGKGCWDIERPIQVIPKTTVPGIYRFVGIVTYEVNTFRKISYSVRTSDFVVEKE